MGQGGFLTLVNGTPYDWQRSHRHSYQMASWDDSFPSVVKAFTSARVYVEFSQGVFSHSSDDGGEIAYRLDGTPHGFEIQARSNGGFSLQAALTEIATLGNRQGSTVRLGWEHNGSVQFVLSGTTSAFTSTSPPTAWMQANLGTLGSRKLRHLCMPGSHDAGMSTLTSGTAMGTRANVITQTQSIGGQLNAGSRYFDIRPVISAGQYVTGHYGRIEKLGVVTWQGGNGQSIDSIISEINAFTACNQELIILRLSHDLNTDVGNDGYRSFTQDEWGGLLTKLTAITDRVVLSHAPVDLTLLPLNGYIGSKAAVVIVVDYGKGTEQFGLLDGKGFFTTSQFPLFDDYAGKDDVNAMVSDQLGKLVLNRPIPDVPFFVLSWTLTQGDFAAVASGLISPLANEGTALGDLFNVRTVNDAPSGTAILDLARRANPVIYERLLGAVSEQVYPNVLYMDAVDNSNIVALAMAVNTLGGTVARVRKTQDNWRYCGKCSGLRYGGHAGVCPAGGSHADASASFNYQLAYDASAATGQDNWRYCNKCSGLRYGANPGVCPAGGSHAADINSSYNYSLPHERPADAGQDNWRYCAKCSGLRYGGHAGVCPAGGSHSTDIDNSYNYCLAH